MVDINTAYSEAKRSLKNDNIINMAEVNGKYVFGTLSKDHKDGEYVSLSGYPFVDMYTGEIGFMSFLEYAEAVDNGQVTEIDISNLK